MYAADADTPAAFLYLPAGAKAIGLNQAFTILGADASAAFYNPATLARIPWSGVSITGSTLSMDRYHTAFSLALCSSNSNSGERRVSAISGSFVFVDELHRYSDGSGIPTGSLDSFSGTLAFSRAYEFASRMNWGFSVAGIFDKQDDTQGYGVALSAGMDINVLIFQLAGSVRNLGFIYYSDLYWLCPTVSGAFSIKLVESLLPSLQYDYTFGVKESGVLRLGLEWIVLQRKPEVSAALAATLYARGLPEEQGRGVELRVRAGIADGTLAGGFSLLLNRVEVSYAVSMADFEETGAVQTVSLNYNF